MKTLTHQEQLFISRMEHFMVLGSTFNEAAALVIESDKKCFKSFVDLPENEKSFATKPLAQKVFGQIHANLL